MKLIENDFRVCVCCLLSLETESNLTSLPFTLFLLQPPAPPPHVRRTVWSSGLHAGAVPIFQFPRIALVSSPPRHLPRHPQLAVTLPLHQSVVLQRLAGQSNDRNDAITVHLSSRISRKCVYSFNYICVRPNIDAHLHI